jgi:hypothetical protein
LEAIGKLTDPICSAQNAKSHPGGRHFHGRGLLRLNMDIAWVTSLTTSQLFAAKAALSLLKVVTAWARKDGAVIG